MGKFICCYGEECDRKRFAISENRGGFSETSGSGDIYDAARSVPGRPMAKSIFLSVKKKCTRCRKTIRSLNACVYQTVHGPWYYFTANDGQINLEKGNYILITTLEGYRKLETFFGIDQVVPIYIEVDDFDRIERALKREKEQNTPCVAELCRRFLADEEDFSEEKLDETGHRHPCPE